MHFNRRSVITSTMNFIGTTIGMEFMCVVQTNDRK